MVFFSMENKHCTENKIYSWNGGIFMSSTVTFLNWFTAPAYNTMELQDQISLAVEEYQKKYSLLTDIGYLKRFCGKLKQNKERLCPSL